jgi:hypothetical protein
MGLVPINAASVIVTAVTLDVSANVIVTIHMAAKISHLVVAQITSPKWTVLTEAPVYVVNVSVRPGRIQKRSVCIFIYMCHSVRYSSTT